MIIAFKSEKEFDNFFIAVHEMELKAPITLYEKPWKLIRLPPEKQFKQDSVKLLVRRF